MIWTQNERIIELYVRDSSRRSRYDNREVYPDGAGVTHSAGEV